MYHFTVKPFDPKLDYKLLCEKIFGGNRCLCMMEKKGGDHLHVQGELAIPEEEADSIRSKWGLDHYRKKLGDQCHPCKKRQRGADEVGFQYMCKELESSLVVYKQGFTDEELEELHASSNAHREELRAGLREYLRDKCPPYVNSTSIPEVHKLMAEHAIDYYYDCGKMPPPNLKLLVRHNLGLIYPTPEVRKYIASFYV